MAEQGVIELEKAESAPSPPSGEGTAVLAPPSPRTAPPRADRLPPWKVLLHNDDVNDMLFVITTIIELTRLTRPAAFKAMLEAHTRGVALLLATHREHAELLAEQFASKKLTVTIEPE